MQGAPLEHWVQSTVLLKTKTQEGRREGRKEKKGRYTHGGICL
jgi:hypothetical protein